MVRKSATFSVLICVTSIVALSALLIAAPAKAQDYWPVNQTWHFDLGVFLVDSKTTVRVDGKNGLIGTEINLKDEFGFDNQDRFRLDGYWRFFEHHKLRLMYFDQNLSSDRTFNREIDFNGTQFQANASIHAEVDTKIIELAYEYSFIKNGSFELAGTFGLHNIQFSTQLSGRVSTSLGLGGNASASSEASANGPLPVIGLRFIWALNDQFYFDGQGQFFKVKFDNYDGNIRDLKLDFIWQPWKNFGFGIGYNDFTTKVTVTKDTFAGTLKLGYGGPLLFATVAF